MPDDAPDAPHEPSKPDWLPLSTLRAMEQAIYRAVAFGRDSTRVMQAARDVALAHMPAAPMPMIAEAVQAAMPDPQGLAAFSPERRGEPLLAATVEDLVSTVAYGFRFDERGKSRRTGYEFTATLAAAQIVKQLELSGYVFFKQPPEQRRPSGLAF